MPLPQGPKRTEADAQAAEGVVVKAKAGDVVAANDDAKGAAGKEDAAKDELVEAQRVKQQAAAKLRQRQQELADKAKQGNAHVDELLVKDVPNDAAHGAVDTEADEAKRHHIPENLQHDTPDQKDNNGIQTTLTIKADKIKSAQLTTNAGLQHVEDEVPKRTLPPVKAPPHDGDGAALVDGQGGRDARKALETGHPAAKVLVAKCQRMTELTASQVCLRALCSTCLHD